MNWAMAGPTGGELSRSPPGPSTLGDTCCRSLQLPWAWPGPAPGPGPGPAPGPGPGPGPSTGPGPGPGPGPGTGPPLAPAAPALSLTHFSSGPPASAPPPQAGWDRPTPAPLIGSAVANGAAVARWAGAARAFPHSTAPPAAARPWPARTQGLRRDGLREGREWHLELFAQQRKVCAQLCRPSLRSWGLGLLREGGEGTGGEGREGDRRGGEGRGGELPCICSGSASLSQTAGLSVLPATALGRRSCVMGAAGVGVG